jgi:cyanophycinase
LLAEAGKPSPRVVCLPTAAGQEGEASIQRWASLGVEHFRRLGAQVEAALVVDRASADDPKWGQLIEQADLIYFSGGNPAYLYRMLLDTRAWQAVVAARQRGAVIAGCSAGAMILGDWIPHVPAPGFRLIRAFGWLTGCLLLPHFDRLPMRAILLPLIRRQLNDGRYALGIDENTALIGRIGGEWQVMGASRVSILTRRTSTKYAVGERLALPQR